MTLSQDFGFAGSAYDVQILSRRFDVNTARTERLCFAKPQGDHASAETVTRACSSPIDKSLKLAGSGHGHSSIVKRFT